MNNFFSSICSDFQSDMLIVKGHNITNLEALSQILDPGPGHSWRQGVGGRWIQLSSAWGAPCLPCWSVWGGRCPWGDWIWVPCCVIWLQETTLCSLLLPTDDQCCCSNHCAELPWFHPLQALHNEPAPARLSDRWAYGWGFWCSGENLH